MPGVNVVHGVPGGLAAINQLGQACAYWWLGLAVVVRLLPRPPPTCPTMTMEVGIVFGVVVPKGVNVRPFVRLICKPPVAPTGTVITTGDQVPIAAAEPVAAVVTDAGLSAAQVAVEPETSAPHV